MNVPSAFATSNVRPQRGVPENFEADLRKSSSCQKVKKMKQKSKKWGTFLVNALTENNPLAGLEH